MFFDKRTKGVYDKQHPYVTISANTLLWLIQLILSGQLAPFLHDTHSPKLHVVRVDGCNWLIYFLVCHCCYSSFSQTIRKCQYCQCHWLMLWTLGLCIVNMHWCRNSDELLTIFVFWAERTAMLVSVARRLIIRVSHFIIPNTKHQTPRSSKPGESFGAWHVRSLFHRIYPFIDSRANVLKLTFNFCQLRSLR